MRIELSNDDKTIIETALVLAHSMVGTINNDYMELYEKMRDVPAEQNEAIIEIKPLPNMRYSVDCPICGETLIACCNKHVIPALKIHARNEHGAIMEVA